MGTQRTIRSTVTLAGVGLHTGTAGRIVCAPAPPHSGITFVRADLPGTEPIPARVESVTDVRRGVTLGGGPSVRTVEHLMAAASGLGIANLRVEVHGEELPALDGSAAPYCRALSAVGLDDQGAVWPPLELDRPVWVAKDSSWVLALPADALRITYVVPTGHQALGTQVADFDTRRQRFVDEIAPARTWGFVEELAALHEAGLARGASPEVALGIGPQGYLTAPRFPDEPARHKLLDLIGDLALLGRPLRGHVIAMGAGHVLHVELARQVERGAGS